MIASDAPHPENLDAKLLPGFERRWITIDNTQILALIGGSGPPLLMLHGDPQTHLCWHHIAPRLVDRFTVVLTDLRGRGESHKPEPGQTPNAFAKRIMAAEQVSVMRQLGFERFALVGHDRGARVARRIALDHPDRVERLCVMDIVPALDLYQSTTSEIAQDYFYFFFLTQPYPQPERLIAGDPEGFQRQILFGLGDKPVPYDADALALYLALSSAPASVSAMCECFRAGYTIDREHDAADREAGRKIQCPTLVLWGEQSVIGRHFDVEAIWNSWCDDARFALMPSGHFIPEEAPDQAYAALNTFLMDEV
ncbi:alpha/beta fold hydrolase [Pseudosulfitobacter pseudonitzschiae]|uniref:alpha/beta fold hydrolase n=1 Tax=Pseudosulfitobacter pseudonitzschiae TaxID=1402135 RepID=UPI001AF14579|nr:alpha/beta hydrolase [Pseudosulfitobacter pseudonitzschiae]MBM1817720.1 alpha/beta hydrolase [Pseudosulfitobacter pseudonitzschiae]MBM1834715.1 alpha/beta hydrolase [Pseudosulfitobacter pseudonitzschiae]MBM1839579.1 alpha/beta hydrolase [Pseudosulfitobacter pseudonitzschiae]MBM1844430.1 alpha/beta hydrolase [Pseudosulfitobacter pseudonitzschiae]MBM1849264.1 alpha/beta hydrolase [Pseudosulfitobacter pseudonitzschiae]